MGTAGSFGQSASSRFQADVIDRKGAMVRVDQVQVQVGSAAATELRAGLTAPATPFLRIVHSRTGAGGGAAGRGVSANRPASVAAWSHDAFPKGSGVDGLPVRPSLLGGFKDPGTVMQSQDAGRTGRRVCAVVVLYGQSFTEALCWPALVANFKRPAARAGAALERVLVYDNTPAPCAASEDRPPWMDCVHDPANGGTGAAYRHAVQWAAAQSAEWLLLLDHDTLLTEDFIDRTLDTIDSLDRTPPSGPVPVALVPVVKHGQEVISPASIGRLGRVVPLPPGPAGATLPDRSTAIASGAVLRVRALQQVLPLPKNLWLDFVDHWLFRELRRHGSMVGIGVSLSHDLSVATPRQTSDFRLRSVVFGEAIFMQQESLLARVVFRLRLLRRALLRSALSPRQRWFLFGFALGMGSTERDGRGADQRMPSS